MQRCIPPIVQIRAREHGGIGFQDAFDEREVVEVDGAAEAEDRGNHSRGAAKGGGGEGGTLLFFFPGFVFAFYFPFVFEIDERWGWGKKEGWVTFVRRGKVKAGVGGK